MLYRKTPGYRIGPPKLKSLILALANGVVPPSTSGPVLISFTAIAAQTDYTAVDVPDLALIVGKMIKSVTDDSTVLLPANWSWDNTTFKIIGLDIAGGENIVIFAQ